MTISVFPWSSTVCEMAERCLHCESGEGIWLQGEAASEAHSFRDAEPHPVIPANANKQL